MADRAQEQEQEEQFFSLFDFYWFEHQIFNKNENPAPQIHENGGSSVDRNENLDFAINVRSYSDQLFLSSKQQLLITDSPNSVLNLQSPKLQTILSGKKVGEFEEIEVKLPSRNHRKVEMKEKKRVLGRRRESKSMSELEFEELKGFMDLGFVFCDKDKSSSLASIIPGLQRLKKGEFGDDEDDDDDPPRPYLSEAWDVTENQRQIEEEEEKTSMVVEVPLMMISELEDEVEIKHQLKFWAHSVASAVR